MATTRALGLALFLLVLFAACAAPPEPIRESRPVTLANSSWTVVAINGVATAPGAQPTAAFGVADVKGSAGCNQFGGGYRYDPATGAIAFDALGMTAMACAEPARNAVEQAFTRAIGQVTSASVDPSGRLVLTGAGGELVLEVAGVPA